MKTTKILSAILACVMGITCMGVNVSAEIGPAESYESIISDVSDEMLEGWSYRSLRSLECDGIYEQEHIITFSEPYYLYDFYDMSVNEIMAVRIVYVDDNVYGTATCLLEKNTASVQKLHTDIILEKLSEALENDKKILFGNCTVNNLPCSLIYIDGTLYNDNCVATNLGATDLVFGEIPYSKSCYEDLGEDEDGVPLPGATLATTIASTTEPAYVMPGIPGDVNLDGKTSLADAVHIHYIMSGIVKVSDQQMELADCYADGIVNASDVSFLVKYIIESIAELPYIPE